MSPRVLAALLAGSVAIVGSRPAIAETLTFEDNGPGYITPIAQYHGLTWTDISILDSSLLGGSGGYVSGAVSPSHVAFTPATDGVSTASVSNPTEFNFESAYLISAYNDGLNVSIEGFRGGSLVYSSVFLLNAALPTFMTFNFLGINELRFTSSGGVRSGSVTYGGSGQNVVIDNATFSFTSVPEPASLAMAGLGGLAVLGLARCRRRAKQG